MNANEIGWGYDAQNTPDLKPTTKDKRTWRFVGNNVHDFMWAADPEYKHIVRKMPGTNGTVLHVLYNYKENDLKNDSAWTKVADAAVKVLPFIESKFGKYPYPQYSFIHGGDGGMEYSMATLLAGPGLGTVFHEWMHSWYQMMLGTNESLYAWMDEGFTSYAEDVVMKFYTGNASINEYKEALKRNPANKNLQDLMPSLPEEHSGGYAGYLSLAKSGYEEPLTTHADHFNTNYAYSTASYAKGEVFLEQLGYIIGAPARDKLLLEYYNQWRFKHPNSTDFIVLAEKVSGLKLDWYKEYFCNSTKTINYAMVDQLIDAGGVTKIPLSRIGQMPMPIDLLVTFNDGTTEMHYIPLNLMYGEKPNENPAQSRIVHDAWRWTHPTYIVEVKRKLTDIKSVEVDPSKRMADTERKNNLLELKWQQQQWRK